MKALVLVAALLLGGCGACGEGGPGYDEDYGRPNEDGTENKTPVPPAKSSTTQSMPSSPQKQQNY